MAVTNCGQCLICLGQWATVEDPIHSCPHDEIQVIALLRAQLEEARAALAISHEAHAIHRRTDDTLMAGAKALRSHLDAVLVAGQELRKSHGWLCLKDCPAEEPCAKVTAWDAAVAASAQPPSKALVINFAQEPDGRWSATASGIATGSVSGTATPGKALHALAYLLNFQSP